MDAFGQAEEPTLAYPITRRSITFERRQYACTITNGGKAQLSDETNDNTGFEPNIAGYLPLLTPKLTKKGTVAVQQPRIPKQSLKWWKAQCGFRGLPVTGNIVDLQARIRDHSADEICESLKRALDAMERECMNEAKIQADDYAKAKENAWKKSDKDAKAKLNPKRFLQESFKMRSGSSQGVTTVEVEDWGNAIENAARYMKIFCETRKMPNHETGQRLAVVGLNEQAVRSKAAELDREIQRSALREREERYEEQLDFKRKFSQAQSTGKGSKSNWDVLGQWEISCPGIEQEWDSKGHKCGLEIFTKPTGDVSMVQMYALFDFIIVEGVMRFVSTATSGNARGKDNKVKSSSKHAHTYGTDDTNYEFCLPKTALPSPGAREFKFRWRGEETGEGEIQLGSDKYLCSMKFESSKALTGVFQSDFTGKVNFRGLKKGSINSTKAVQRQSWSGIGYTPDPDYEWKTRDEESYERERVDRWR